MKHVKRILAYALTLVMAFAIALPAWAQTKAYEGTDGDNATITVNNPANGETYAVHKLFDATVSSDGNIAYQGAVPTSLNAYFTADANGNISPTDAIAIKDGEGKITGTIMTVELKSALEAWATDANVTAEAVSTGDVLEFTNLPYGYYVMTTTHKSDAVNGAEAKAAISVTSTKPNATINDKNVNQPSADKQADKESYSVGDTITYTATFDAPNYMEKESGSNGESEQVVSYTITDTLPEFLSDVTITSVKVKQPGVTEDVTVPGITGFDSNRTITVPWADQTILPNGYKYTSKYKAGSQIEVIYTAKLTAAANIGAANTNTVSIMPNVDRGDVNEPEPYQEEDEWHDSASITTYAAKIKKIDGDTKNVLTGAKFKFKGLTLEGSNGIYTVVSYDASGADDSGTEVEVGSNGTITIAGIDVNITLKGTETKAPEGYNKLNGTFDVKPVKLSDETTTTWGTKKTYYDAQGNVVNSEVQSSSSVGTWTYATIESIPENAVVLVENNKGTELPSTGGIGTTIFYIVGGVMVAGAVIFLLTKRRVTAE